MEREWIPITPAILTRGQPVMVVLESLHLPARTKRDLLQETSAPARGLIVNSA